jgi:hypothetical protein
MRKFVSAVLVVIGLGTIIRAALEQFPPARANICLAGIAFMVFGIIVRFGRARIFQTARHGVMNMAAGAARLGIGR